MRAERCIVYSSISDHRPAQAMVICVEEGQLPADGLFSEKKSVSGLPGSRVRVAKLGSTMRRVPVSVMKTLVTGADIKPRAGDLVLARVKHVGHQSRLHLPCGRRARLFKGSEIIVPYGNRYAVHQFEAVVPETLGECQLVAAGGVAGKVTSQHDGVRSATVLEPIGLVGNIIPKSRVGGPQFLAFDKAGHLYTTEGMMGRVQKLTREGQPILSWGNLKDEPGGFGGKFIVSKDKVANLEGPIGITVDPHDHIWVASINGRIQQFDTNGKLLGGLQSGQGSEPGKFSAPHTLAFNSRGDLFIVDSFNQRIQKFAMK